MMASPHLPNEIWLMVLEFLPVSFFQQDIRRLTISKEWYSLAFSVFLSKVEYTPRVISRFLHRKTRSHYKSRIRLRQTQRCVRIVLDGIAPKGGLDDVCFDTVSNLRSFASDLRHFKGLEEVHFVARWPNKHWLADPFQASYLPVRSIEPYILLPKINSQLTKLELDLRGTNVIDTVHFCSYIGTLLTRVQILRLSLRCICPAALSPPPRETRVKHLSLNLYLGRVSEANPKLNMTTTCTSRDPWQWSSPECELRQKMIHLVAEMPDPMKVRAVYLDKSGYVHIWDATTDSSERDLEIKPFMGLWDDWL